MLNKKTIKDILLEVEAYCYNYEKYLQEVVDIVLNDNNGDIKNIIVNASNYNNCLHLYKYSKSNYITWLYNNFYIDDANVDDLINNYEIIKEYVQHNNIDYYVENNILNFINIKKFRKELYNNKLLLQEVINDIFTNVRNYANNEYLINEYNLNKELYKDLLKIKRGLKG